MLKLVFFPTEGGIPVYTRASYFRFCTDGTVRGSDNSVAAICSESRWRLGRRLFRELECVGPVWLRFRNARGASAMTIGPFACVNTHAGKLFGDGAQLPVMVPGWVCDIGTPCYEVVLLESLPRDGTPQQDDRPL